MRRLHGAGVGEGLDRLADQRIAGVEEGGTYAEMAKVIQYDCTGQYNAQWKGYEYEYEYDGNGVERLYYALMPRHVGYCLNSSGGTRANGNPMILFRCAPYDGADYYWNSLFTWY